MRNYLTTTYGRFAKITSFVVFIFLIVSLGFMAILPASGQTAIAETYIISKKFPRPDSNENLHYAFISPSLICADNTFLYVLDNISESESKIVTFSLDTFKPLDKEKQISVATNITKMIAVDRYIYTLEDGYIFEYNYLTGKTKRSIISEQFNDIYVTNDLIYATLKDSSNVVKVFNRDLNEQTFELLASYSFMSDKSLKELAVIDNVIFATNTTVGNSSKDDVQYRNTSSITNKPDFSKENINTVIDMQIIDKNAVLIWHKSQISIYSITTTDKTQINEGASIPSSDSGAGRADTISVTMAGNGIYLLDGNKAIIKFDFSLKNPTFAVVPAYYLNPVDVTTRKNNTYIADKSLDKVVIYNGESRSFSTVNKFSDGILQPSSITVDYSGNLYIAYNENKIAIFDSKNKRIKNGGNTAEEVLKSEVVKVVNSDGSDYSKSVSILDIKFDGKNNLYMLLSSGELFIMADGADSFKPINLFNSNDVSKKVVAMSTSINSAYLYLVVSTTTTNVVTNEVYELQRDVYRFNGTAISPAPIISDSPDIIDIAADVNNGFYILLSGNKIVAYDFNLSSSDYEIRKDDNGTSLEFLLSDATKLSKICVSHIIVGGDSENIVNYRDLIAIDSEQKSIEKISNDLLYASEGATNAPTINESEDGTILDADQSGNIIDNKLIRTINKAGGCPIYGSSSELQVIGTLPQGFKVIVPNFDISSTYSLVYADNIIIGSSNSSNDKIIVGYVNNEFLSNPAREYTTKSQMDSLHAANILPKACSIWLSSAAIYKFPSVQSPTVTGFTNVLKGTTFEILPFVYDYVDAPTSRDSIEGLEYGYDDNFPSKSDYKYKWYRIKLMSTDQSGKNIYYEGYVISTQISIYGSNPQITRLRTNAEIIAKDKNLQTVGAFIYNLNSEKKLAVDTRYMPLPVGTKVEVVGVFDSSKKHTEIIFTTKYGTVTAFVETANLKYDGVNLVQVVAIVLITLTLIVIVFILVRMYVVKKRKINKV